MLDRPTITAADSPQQPRESGVAAGESRLVYHGIFAQKPGKGGSGSGVSRAAVRMLLDHSRHAGDLPVARVERYRRDWVVKRDCENTLVPKGGQRDVIKEFSYEARYRLLHFCKNCNADFFSMLTITYPRDFPRDGKAVKNDLRKFKQWLQREVEGIQGVWFLEFQRRGAPHFHFLLSVDLRDQGTLITKRRGGTRRGEKSDTYATVDICEKRAAASWYRIVKSGDEKHLKAGVCWEVLESHDAALRYAAMHAGKPKQKEVPEDYQNVGRFWGKIGPIAIVGGEEFEMTSEQIFERFGVDAMSRKGRIKKYLWDAETAVETGKINIPDEAEQGAGQFTKLPPQEPF